MSWLHQLPGWKRCEWMEYYIQLFIWTFIIICWFWPCYVFRLLGSCLRWGEHHAIISMLFDIALPSVCVCVCTEHWNACGHIRAHITCIFIISCNLGDCRSVSVTVSIASIPWPNAGTISAKWAHQMSTNAQCFPFAQHGIGVSEWFFWQKVAFNKGPNLDKWSVRRVVTKRAEHSIKFAQKEVSTRRTFFLLCPKPKQKWLIRCGASLQVAKLLGTCLPRTTG